MGIAHFLVNDVLVAVEIFFRTCVSALSPTPSSTIVSQSSRVRKYSSMNSIVSSTALCDTSTVCEYNRASEIETRRGTYRALVHERLHDVREERGNVRLPNLGLVTGNLEPHACLDICELPVELRLLRVLAKPSAGERQRQLKVCAMYGVERWAGRRGTHCGKDMALGPP